MQSCNTWRVWSRVRGVSPSPVLFFILTDFADTNQTSCRQLSYQLLIGWRCTWPFISAPCCLMTRKKLFILFSKTRLLVVGGSVIVIRISNCHLEYKVRYYNINFNIYFIRHLQNGIFSQRPSFNQSAWRRLVTRSGCVILRVIKVAWLSVSHMTIYVIDSMGLGRPTGRFDRFGLRIVKVHFTDGATNFQDILCWRFAVIFDKVAMIGKTIERMAVQLLFLTLPEFD